MLSPSEAAFTARQRVAHLATANAAGRPHVVPICFVYLDGRVYSPVDDKPKRTLRLARLRNIEANPQAAVIFDEYDEDWRRLRYVILRGRADILEPGRDEDERARALAALREKYPQYRDMPLEGRSIIRVTPEAAASWSGGSNKAT